MHHQSLTELSALLEAKKISAVELTQHYLTRIQQYDNQLNSFITVTAEQALAQAQQADQLRAQQQAGKLTGIPIAHKDLFCTQGVKTTCASKMLDNFISPYDATAVVQLAQAGIVCLGKLNMDEFAMGATNETSAYGAVKNPWNLSHSPGGSSGGSAAAVAARLVPAATATDTGGSIRLPASWTGVTGIKPTYGRVSRFGMIAFASSLDQGGVMAQSAADCALLLQHMAGFDPKDSTSIDQPVPDYSALLGKDIKGLKIGLPKEFFGDGLDPHVAQVIERALDEFRRLGATVQEVSLPNTHLVVPCYYIIAPAEASSNLSRYDGVRFGYRCKDPVDLLDMYRRSRSEGFGAEVQRRILIGTYVLSASAYDAYYLQAQKIRRMIHADYQAALDQVDILLGPASPTLASRLGAHESDPTNAYLNDIFNIGVNMAGLPGMSIPVGFANDMPVGAQLIGKAFSEGQLFNVADQYQRVTDWHRQAPPAF